MKTALIIRLAEPRDIPALTEMQVAIERHFNSYGQTNPLGGGKKIKISAQSRSAYIRRLHFPTGGAPLRTLVAEIGNEIAGRVSFYRGYGSDCPPYSMFHLSGIFVKPEYRGQKIAEELFAALKKIACREKIKIISWLLDKDNSSAQKFYARIGGKFWADPPTNETYMYLPVK